MKKVKEKTSKKYFEWFETFYDDLLDLANVFKKSDNQKRMRMIIDLLFLVVITCVLKIPFIFVRNIGDNLISIILNGNINVLAIWGLLIEILYVIIALSFFMKTLKKWMKNVD